MPAVFCYRQAIRLFRGNGDYYRVAVTMGLLGDALDAAGVRDAARDTWQEALLSLEEFHHPDAERVRTKLEAWGPEPIARDPVVAR
jgi:hypothetical protein